MSGKCRNKTRSLAFETNRIPIVVSPLILPEIQFKSYCLHGIILDPMYDSRTIKFILRPTSARFPDKNDIARLLLISNFSTSLPRSEIPSLEIMNETAILPDAGNSLLDGPRLFSFHLPRDSIRGPSIFPRSDFHIPFVHKVQHRSALDTFVIRGKGAI